jgi:hypothetical protein
VTEVIHVKRGAGWRFASLGCVVFVGCAAFDHHQCVDFPSVFGPCSWWHSLWEAAKTLAIGCAGSAAMLVASLWVSGMISFRSRRS